MSEDLEKKIDRLTHLLEEQELAQYRQSCRNNKNMLRDLTINTILASVLGYFIMRILDYHFRPAAK